MEGDQFMAKRWIGYTRKGRGEERSMGEERSIREVNMAS